MNFLQQFVLSTLSRRDKLDNWFRRGQQYCARFALGSCRLCGETAPGDGLCADCTRDLPILGSTLATRIRSIDLLRVGFRYEFPIDWLIAEAKFKGNIGVAKLLANIFVEQLKSRSEKPDLIIPIPMPWLRLLRRGYNQAHVIAVEIGRRLDINVRADVLVRRGWQPPQHGLSGQQRKRNLRRAFAVIQNIQGCRIAIVDDVFTTGATTRLAAALLTRAGAARVEVWVVAATL